MRRDAARETGFTLIEMIVVIAVLALAAGLVLARGPMRSATVDLRAAARTMAGEMRNTRARAIGEDRPLVFVLDLAHRDYGLKGGKRYVLPPNVRVDARDDVRDETVSFRPDGSCSGGTMVLAEGERTISITADWLTGAVSVR